MYHSAGGTYARGGHILALMRSDTTQIQRQSPTAPPPCSWSCTRFSSSSTLAVDRSMTAA